MESDLAIHAVGVNIHSWHIYTCVLQYVIHACAYQEMYFLFTELFCDHRAGSKITLWDRGCHWLSLMVHVISPSSTRMEMGTHHTLFLQFISLDTLPFSVSHLRDLKSSSNELKGRGSHIDAYGFHVYMTWPV